MRSLRSRSTSFRFVLSIVTALAAATTAVGQDVGVPRWVALQRASTGACEVVYGTAEVQAADRVFGLYANREDAEAALATHCSGSATRPSPTATPTRVPATPTTSWRTQVVSPTPTSGPYAAPTATPEWQAQLRPSPTAVAVEGWRDYPEAAACIGGSRCGGDAAVVAISLEDAPVVGIRFSAHDDVGSHRNGRLRLEVDGRRIAEIGEITRLATPHEIALDGLRGQRLVIAPAADDEVVIAEVAVRYGSQREPAQPWTPYPEAKVCFGGSRCAEQGNHVIVSLKDQPISGVRLRAHDDVGNVTKAHLQLRIDGTVIAHDLDIQRSGSSFEVELGGIRGEQLVVTTLTDDEAVISELAVRYGLPEQTPGWRSLIAAPACLGGSLCDSSGSKLRLELGGDRLTAVRLVLHDRVGSLSNGRLRVTVDEQTLETINVPDSPTAIELGLGGAPVHWLVLEAVTDDEVVLERIEVHTP